MADIKKQLDELEKSSTNGRASRDIIIDIFNNINNNGTNVKTFNGYTSDYFVTKAEFDMKTNEYLRKIGLVHDVKKLLDPKGTPVPLTSQYKNNVIDIPFEKKSSDTTIIDASSVTQSQSNATYDRTFMTNYALWTILGYTDLQDLQDIINS